MTEGGEDQQTPDLLAAMGRHLVQGRHLSRPTPIATCPAGRGWTTRPTPARR
ncbi:hypothetical protein [Petropleomorpha daqingensis]|uniref:EAL domain-containing protein (Putative c-di-GMP-specific phosphodiesterase class I) n=1 Tax=Petropleomorpha daqingensis TaxID=2026353 RepID=A0A853CFN2_9ACTN|nr:hypothetical protein [Petropleomorpha daqingensis]NYJ06714.1 EAL domain-containing protein (putative c-di-GMP-specific phosphodiesterase class I) [Petropleomorpha daqingensis]